MCIYIGIVLAWLSACCLLISATKNMLNVSHFFSFFLSFPDFHFQHWNCIGFALIVSICCLKLVKIQTKTYFWIGASKKSDSTVASLPSNVSIPAKSQATTAPTATFHSLKSSIPPLKQKTGIVKSKVPPPVPPRGSPRDRRDTGGSQKITASAHGTPSISGSLNYLNDKFFDCVRPNPNNLCKLTPVRLHARSPTTQNRSALSPAPIFGDRRSPTCVRDWLEVNDFSASNYEQSIIECREMLPVDTMPFNVARKPIPFKTAILQRENSFRASNNSGSSVRLMVKNYSKNINSKYKSIQKNTVKDINAVNGLDINGSRKITDEQFIPNGHVKTLKSRLETRYIDWVFA